jgi:hypothetical protein
MYNNKKRKSRSVEKVKISVVARSGDGRMD